MKFSENNAVIVFLSLWKFYLFYYTTFLLNMIYWLHEYWQFKKKYFQTPTDLVTPRIIYYRLLHMKRNT